MSDTFVFIPRDDKPGFGSWINMSYVSHITVTPTVMTINIGDTVINVRNDDSIFDLKTYLSQKWS